MLVAYVQGDPSRKPVGAKRFLLAKKPGTTVALVPCCLVCNQAVSARSPSGKIPHFAHKRHAACPTVAKAHAPFARLKKQGFDPSASRARKAFALAHIHAVFEAVASLVPALDTTEFLELMREAGRKRMWQLKGLTDAVLPFFLVCCADVFSPRKGRKLGLFFVLDAEAGTSTYWNFPDHPGHVVFRVRVTAKGRRNIVEHLPVARFDPVSILEAVAQRILGL